MSVEFFREARIKSKKIYRCDSCLRQIELGEVSAYIVGKSDGDFWTCRQHADCREAGIALNYHFETDEWDSLDGLVNGWGNCAEHDEALAILADKFPRVHARFLPSKTRGETDA